jgi:hypothetical protein
MRVAATLSGAPATVDGARSARKPGKKFRESSLFNDLRDESVPTRLLARFLRPRGCKLSFDERIA